MAHDTGYMRVRWFINLTQPRQKDMAHCTGPQGVVVGDCRVKNELLWNVDLE